MTQKSPRKCIFCGDGNNISKEHYWPRWLREYVSIDGKYTYHNGSIGQIPVPGIPEHGFELVNPTRRTGDPYSQRLQVVCKSCNNNWMSQLQDAAKPLLIPHINGEWPDKNSADQQKLAAWAVMFTMVFEFKHRETIGVSQSQRREFMQSRLPPKNWFVWCGQYKGNLWSDSRCINHFGLLGRKLSIDLTEKILSGKSEETLFLAQSTAFTLGSIFIMTFSWIDDAITEFDTNAFAGENNLKTIWPIRSEIVSAPYHVLTDVQADQVSRALVHPDIRQNVRPAWIF